MTIAALFPAVTGRSNEAVRAVPIEGITLHQVHWRHWALHIPHSNPDVDREALAALKSDYRARNDRSVTFCDAWTNQLRITGDQGQLLQICRSLGVVPIQL